MKNLNDIARSLYDGGWRCEDLKDIMEEYEYSYEEAYEICQELEVLEDGVLQAETKEGRSPSFLHNNNEID